MVILVVSTVEDWPIYSHYHYFAPKMFPMISPIDSTQWTLPLEDTYGAYREPDRYHQGVDVFCPLNTPIRNAHPGHIVRIGENRLGGKTIWVLGYDNRLYYYAHLNHYGKQRRGDRVKQGEIIAFAGNSGNALYTPVHLHFEIMVIERLFPLKKTNLNPYPELCTSSHKISSPLQVQDMSSSCQK
jgi:murein DD-endopeptidase MepM/ murein hydrolase activator NlpD